MKPFTQRIAEASHTKVAIIASFFVGLCVLVSFCINLPHSSAARVQAALADAGFKNARVETITLSPGVIRAENIKLDQDGFDHIKTLEADVGLLGFFMGGKINALRIKGMTLTRTGGALAPSAQQLVKNLLSLPDYRITLSDVIVDMDTGYGAIRIAVNATVNDEKKSKDREIKARITANQYQLSFDSEWNGKLKEDGSLELSANILDGRLNFGPLRASRFNGWLGADVSAKGYSLQSQMQAGSASFLDVPLQTVALAADFNSGKSTLTFRSGVSGIPDVNFTADYAGTADTENFTALLSGNDLGALLNHVSTVTEKKKNIREPLQKGGPFSLSWKFDPAQQFTGGPLPFEVAFKTSGREALKGNLLFYPDTQDMRGSLESNAAMADALRDYFQIPYKNIQDNYIRVDGSLKNFLKTVEPKTAYKAPEYSDDMSAPMPMIGF